LLCLEVIISNPPFALSELGNLPLSQFVLLSFASSGVIAFPSFPAAKAEILQSPELRCFGRGGHALKLEAYSGG